ncbi:phage major capsid protein HK97 family [Clostridium sp. CAG:221]|uniref:phage major capsid protein n=1 Tax=Clostridium sp. CAG:221 TaxID=1262780 RepID=UPI00033F9D2D|nr:phage major capsid protein [Clostridium sp. CAG:221]CDB16176.1 phage major capsid protein HK97 family [Clostridium sp. CAG:221]
MNKEIKKLAREIKNKQEEIKQLASEGNIEESKLAKEELIKMQAKFEVLFDLDDDYSEAERNNALNKGKILNGKEDSKEVENSFINAIKAGLLKQQVSEKDMRILSNSMKEGTDADGGLTVPKDIQTSIKELRRGQDALENYVNVEKVSTLSGSRVIEKYAEHTPFDNVEEESEFPDVSTPQFENIPYKIKKKGGILKVTRELLQDTAENILSYLRRWIAKKSKATRNALIINKINEMTNGKEVAITGVDDIKKIFNVNLDPDIASGSIIITNQDGFNWLDTQKDATGNYILQSDPTQRTKELLFGKYPIVKMSNKTLKTTAKKAPFICGDLKEAITLFDRENMTIEISTEAGDLWNKDQTGIKVRERLDIQAVDSEAIIKGQITLP